MEHLKFTKSLSTEDLKAVFDPAYSEKLNCSLAEHILRLMCFELVERGEKMNDLMYEAFVGPSECLHGRSTYGTCGECDADADLSFDGEEEDPN